MQLGEEGRESLGRWKLGMTVDGMEAKQWMTGGTGRRGWSFGWELVKMKDGEEGDGEGWGLLGMARKEGGGRELGI